MDIKEFVKQSLTQIAEAVSEANADFGKCNPGASVNPAGGSNATAVSITYIPVPDVHTISFDIAVSAAESKTISVVSATMGSTGSEGENSSVSRIRFSIPLKLPRPPNR